MATIKDIAALAGVSHGTVSNVLNGRGNVSVEKITLVENAARQLGYTINAQARQLRKGTSKRVGVIVPRIGIKRYQDLYLGIEQELKMKPEEEMEQQLPPGISESGEVVDMAAYEAWQQENHPDIQQQMQRREEVNINVHRERGEDVEPGDDF